MQRKTLHKQYKKLGISAVRRIGFSFFAVILIGSILLSLPMSHSVHSTSSYLDHLFVATSATCVTGLVTHVTASEYTLFGQIVIILLIQIGGLGFLTLMSMFFVLLKRKLTYANKIVMQEALNRNSLNETGIYIKRVIKYTVCFELIGAICLAFVFIPQFGILKGIYYSLFHAISAFCNAGFDILGTPANPFPSITAYAGNPIVNVVIMFLIIAGGIGFLTWEDICINKIHFRKYHMQSKIILVTTAFLIVLPAIFFFFSDFTYLSVGKRLLASAFQAVTPRTAGFNTMDISKMTEVSKAMIIILMLVGGSPSSTAGGMKTTTFAVLILNAFATFRSQENVETFGRRIEYSVIKNASTIAMMYCMLFLCGGITISVYEGLPLLECLYEAASAVGTVGLTLGITPKLHIVSQFILIILMYLGRVGGLTLIYAVLSKKKKGNARLPLEKLTVG